MKKRILAFLLAGAMLGTLMGCGRSEEEGDTEIVRVQIIGDFKMEESTNPITGEKRDGLEVVKKDFESKYPGIQLEFITMGWDDYAKKTQTMIMSDQADVFQVPGISALVDMDVLEPLQPYIEKDEFDLDVYLDGEVEGWMVQGPEDKEPQIYSLPFIGDTRYIAYDKKIFDEWGVPYLSENPSIEEVMEAAKKMTGINPKTGKQNYGITWRGTDSADNLVNIAEALGGTWGEGARFDELKYNFDSPEMIRAAEILKEMRQYAPEGVMTNAGSENFGKGDNDVAIYLRVEPKEVINAKELGLQDQYGASYAFVNEKLGMGSLFAGSPYAISKSSKVKDAAWEFIKYTSTDYFQKFMWSEYMQLPCVKSGLEFEGIKGDENMELILNSMTKLWTPRYTYRAGGPRNMLSEATESVVNGSATAEEALSKAQQDAEQWTSEQ